MEYTYNLVVHFKNLQGKLMRILLALLMATILFGSQPYNSNILVEYKIDPKILNNVISATRQNVAYRMQMKHQIISNDEQENLNYYVIVDPYPVYGTEMKIQLPKEELKNYDTDEIEKNIDELMGVQLYIQENNLFDESSLKILKKSDEETIIGFTFKRDALPRELKHIRDMEGKVFILNNQLDRIEITHDERFNLSHIEVDRYKKISYFKPVVSGGYLISKESLEIDGTLNNKPYHEQLDGTIAEYWDAQRQIITYDNGVSDEIVNTDDSKYQTIALDLDRIFPLLGKEARRSGYDLPKPFGVSLINMFQDTTMHMTSFDIDNIPIDFNKVLDGKSVYKNITYAPLIRADVWVLPFLSVGLILGGTDTTTNVTLHSESGLTIERPVLGDIVLIEPGAKLNLDPFTTNALMYGVGVTLAGGVGNYFTTIDFQYITAYTPDADVSIDMLIMTPLIGYTFTDYGTRLFVGAQYQDLKEEITFNVIADGKQLSGRVGLQSEDWAGVIGTDYSFNRNWSANLLYSQGVDRKNAILGISYRF